MIKRKTNKHSGIIEALHQAQKIAFSPFIFQACVAAKRLGVLAALHLQRAESPICKADVLIPVPLHPRKQRKRGYNQAEWICKGMSSVLQIPVDTRFLHRVSYTETQTKKSVAERWDNLHSRFRVDGTCDWQGKRLVLVDDVLTTGATLVDCASAINAKSVTSDVTLFALSAV